MKGFITVRDIGVNDPNNIYYINITAISFFHKLAHEQLEDVIKQQNIVVEDDNIPRAMIHLCSVDYKEKSSKIVLVSNTVEELIAMIEAAQ
ncbi:MAG: hypothetical protein BGO69_03260 [Bacteroidetes bacterium 46-16]|nr:MAG: hypothetical protein BGO69_03260 [Bacteroidetes bacterium 46-16]